MEPWSEDDPNCDFYDSDTPSDAATLDAHARRIGLGDDVPFYRALAANSGAAQHVLVLCCGTGRVALPILADNHTVTAVDASPGMLRRFREKLENRGEPERTRLTLVQADVTEIQFDGEFDLTIIPYNSITSVPSFDAQLKVFQKAFAALRPGGLFAADIVNALLVPRGASLRPLLMYARRHLTRGTRYSRYGFNDALQADQTQRVFGYYDEILANGTLIRHEWEKEVRLIFPFELKAMLLLCGFLDVELTNFGRTPLRASDEKITVLARKPR